MELYEYSNPLLNTVSNWVVSFTLIVLLAMVKTCKKVLSNLKYQRVGNYNLTFNVYIVHYKVPLVK